MTATFSPNRFVSPWVSTAHGDVASILPGTPTAFDRDRFVRRVTDMTRHYADEFVTTIRDVPD